MAPTLIEVLSALHWRAVMPEGALKHDVYDETGAIVGERMEAYQVWRVLRRRRLVTREGYLRLEGDRWWREFRRGRIK